MENNFSTNFYTFGKVYADAYDLFYNDKDYEAECDMIEEVFRRYGSGNIKTILDLGCGTGNHAVPLSRRGYNVTGVDCSAEMLSHARNKISSEENQPVFLGGDLLSLNLNQQFDAVLMMFAVLGYQTTNNDVFAALRVVRNHLKPGGLYVFDVWYGPAVLTIRPGDKVKIIPTEKGKIIRTTSGSLDILNELAEVRYYVIHMRNNSVLAEGEEVHTMRYFFPQELTFFLSQAGLEMLLLRAFGNLDQEPSEDSWNALVVAK